MLNYKSSKVKQTPIENMQHVPSLIYHIFWSKVQVLKPDTPLNEHVRKEDDQQGNQNSTAQIKA